MSLGEKLSDLRNLYQMSQKDVSRELNVSNHLIGKYEKGVIQPSLDILVKFASLYNTSVDYLLGLENHRVIVLDRIPMDKKNVVSGMVNLMMDYFHSKDGDMYE